MSFKEAGQTKAILDAETFATNGNQIKVYDFYTDANQSEYIYINDIATSSGNGTWPFTESHKWTTDGVHKFFGWMTNDASSGLKATDLYESGLSFDDKKKILEVPITTLTQESPQFDFMYSNIHVRDLNNNPYFTAVPLEFSHLFTAFNITAENKSSNRIDLRSVTITGLKNSRSATIDYFADTPAVEYLNPASSGSFTFNKEVDGNGCVLPPYNQEQPVGPEGVSNGYFLMWPHSKADFKGDETLPEAKITIVYDYIELDSQGEATMTQSNVSKDVLLENVGTWVAGNKYDLNLVFKDKEIILECIVQNWIPMEEEIDFTEQVYASKPLTWDLTTVEDDNTESGRVILYSDEKKTAVCRFQIDTPKGATWTASLIPIEGHPDAFAIVDDTKYGPVGIESEIKIKITNIDPISPRHACKLRITVQTADGRTIVVNNLMPDNTNESVTEYTIIQNLING